MDRLPEAIEPPPAAPRGFLAWLRTRFARVRAFRLWLRFLRLPLLLLAAVLVYLGAVGLPSPLTARLVDRLRAEGFDVRMRRVRLNVLRGVLADQVRFHAADVPETPVLEADRVRLVFDPFEWLRGRFGLRELHLRNGVFRLMAASSPAISRNTPLRRWSSRRPNRPRSHSNGSKTSRTRSASSTGASGMSAA